MILKIKFKIILILISIFLLNGCNTAKGTSEGTKEMGQGASKVGEGTVKIGQGVVEGASKVGEGTVKIGQGVAEIVGGTVPIADCIIEDLVDVGEFIIERTTGN